MAQLDEKVRAFLTADPPRFAVVATINADGTPQQTVLWYIVEGDEIMMNTAQGRVKDHNLARDPRISFCVEDGYKYVTLRGTATLIDDPETAQADIRALAIRYDGIEQWEAMTDNPFTKQTRLTIRMQVERVDATHLR